MTVTTVTTVSVALVPVLVQLELAWAPPPLVQPLVWALRPQSQPPLQQRPQPP